MKLQANHISFQVHGKTILEETSMQFESGKFYVIMGANGAGKSTLLKILSGNLKSNTGSVQLGERDISRYSTAQLARIRAVLSQHYSIQFPLTVAEIIMMGRYPWYKSEPAPDDYQIRNRAMEAMEIHELHERDYNTLSGGEAQKVQMSRVLAQIWTENTRGDKILFLDEPVSHLDMKYQHQLLKMAREQSAAGNTVIAVLHDINLTLQYADLILFMKEGRIVDTLQEFTSITPELIKNVFDIQASVIRIEPGSKPVVVFK